MSLRANINGVESEKSHSWWWDSHISPNNSKWLTENLEEVDQSVKAMLKLIEEDGDSFGKKAGMDYERRPELIAHVEGFYRMYRLLAERYDRLTGELRKNVPSVLQMQNSVISQAGSGQECPLVTPDQKLGLNKFGQQAVGFDLFLSSGDGSSDLSLKEGSESSSSASDSESESFDSSVNKHSNPHMTGDGKWLHQKIIDRETELPGMKENIMVTKKENATDDLKAQEKGGYTALLKRISECDKELKESNKKLQLSQEEVAKLKNELKKNEAVTVLIGDLQDQLESAQRDVKMQGANLEMEQRRVLELQKEVAELETQVSDSSRKIGTLMKELEIAREKLKVSEEKIGILKSGLCNEISECTHQLQGQLELAQKDIAMLEASLDSEKRQVLELQERIIRHVADAADRDQEIKELNVGLCDTQKTFSLEKAKLQSDISILSEQLALLGASVEESELRSKSLENEIRQCEAEKKEMKYLHEAQQIGMWGEIERLKADVSERGELVEALNKKLDILKLKYDMLMAEKDGVNAKLQTHIADLSSRDNHIQQLEEHLRQMHIEHVELIAGSESARKLADEVDELRVRAGELEKEVDRQRVVISDRAEEKREAIRQLCFSLEHYRNGYQELRQAFIGHKRHAVLAS